MDIKRKFIPGDEWLYYKFYLGKYSVNRFITSCIYPLAEDLYNLEICSSWFFIRYHDPDHHVRYRLKLNDVNNCGVVIQNIQEQIQSYLSEDIIWKVQLDTYERELERYNYENIHESENLFQINSILCCELLLFTTDEEKLIQTAISILLLLFENLKSSSIDIHLFIAKNQKAFKKEQNPSKYVEKLLKQKFSELGLQIENKSVDLPSNHVISQLVNQYNSKLTETISTIENIDVAERFLSSHIHMFVNRLFIDKQRLYEMIIYDFIERFYYRKIKT